jgi:hypothetical protein
MLVRLVRNVASRCSEPALYRWIEEEIAMRARTVAVLLVLLLAGYGRSSLGALIVNSADPIEHIVRVRVILAAEDDGSPIATSFGTGSTREHIEREIDRVWAQAGIDVEFDPIEPIYSSTFALRGNHGSGARPSSDFNPVLSGAASAGHTSPDPKTINLVLVDHVPGFNPHSENSSAGRARVRGNGIIGFAGHNLLGFSAGRDVIASVMSHEIGHNLGLSHTANNLPNLMSPGGSTDQLTAAQISTVLTSSLVQSLPTLEGDYNGDGLVNAADYTLWRDAFGTPDPIGSYAEWSSNYGMSESLSISVPEPAGGMLLFLAALLTAVGWRSGVCV